MAKKAAYDALMKQLARRLKLTQEQLAVGIGVSLPTVNRWTTGAAKPDKMGQRALRNYIVQRGAWSLWVTHVGANHLDDQEAVRDVACRQTYALMTVDKNRYSVIKRVATHTPAAGEKTEPYAEWEEIEGGLTKSAAVRKLHELLIDQAV